MKKLGIGLISMLSILAGTTSVAIAKGNQQKLNVRFTENNTLLVAAPNMLQARLYNQNGLLLNSEEGNVVRFELEQGTYLLFADLEDETVARKVILK